MATWAEATRMGSRLLPVRTGLVEVRLDWTWWAMLGLSSLLMGGLARGIGGLPAVPSASIGIGFALALASSVLVHEAGHAVVGARLGRQPLAIRGSWLGGAVVYQRPAPGPGTKALSAAAGPAASLLLAALAWGIAAVQPDLLVRLALQSFAGLNASYALLNLVPAYPQDGGQLLHALCWWLIGDESRALRAAGRFGLALAVIFFAASVVVGAQLFLLSGVLLAGQSIFLALASAKTIALA